MGQRVVLRTVVRYTYTPHCHLFILVWHAFPLAKVSHLTFFFFWWSIFISWFSKLAQGGERETHGDGTRHTTNASFPGSKLTRHQLLSPQRSAQNGPSLRTCLGSRLRGRGSPRRRGLDSDHGVSYAGTALGDAVRAKQIGFLAGLEGLSAEADTADQEREGKDDALYCALQKLVYDMGPSRPFVSFLAFTFHFPSIVSCCFSLRRFTFCECAVLFRFVFQVFTC